MRGDSGRQVMHTTIPCMLTASDPLLFGVRAGDAQVNGRGPFAFVLNLGAMQTLSAAELRLS
jgi:hypothetical protein